MPSYTITFKPNPDSLVIGSGVYVIPVGKFAFISAVQGSVDFEIDSNIILNATSVTAVLYTITGGGGYTVPSNHFFEGQFSGNAGASVSISGAGAIATSTGVTNFVTSFRAGPSQGLNFFGAAGSITGYTRAQTESPFSTWIPEGTQVEGGRYVVSLFDE